MNYYDARIRKTDGRWDYTCRNDGKVWPVGYCMPWDRIAKADVNFPGLGPLDDTHKDKHHDGGHETPDEARACYRQYLLDHHVRLDRNSGMAHYPCRVCQVLTNGSASVKYHTWPLCDAHRTQEQVEKLLPPVHSSTES